MSLDFQQISDASFETEQGFIQAFCRAIVSRSSNISVPEDIIQKLKEYAVRQENKIVFDELFYTLNEWCRESDKPIVMIIDEVDSATNNQVFLDFLAQLRACFIEREHTGLKTFQSVILAGVTDVKYIKSKIRDDGQHKVNSPWNIAVDFKVDMSLSKDSIEDMLRQYEDDHNTGMNIEDIATSIYDYTSGYPYLVSKICFAIDRTDDILNRIPNRNDAWSRYGVDEAVKLILKEENIPLFDSLIGKLINYPDLKQKLYRVLMLGETIEYLPYDDAQRQLRMYGFAKEENGIVKVSNRIFETLLYNQFLGEAT